METLYKKVGRKYVPHSVEWSSNDHLKVGQFRLHYAYENGGGMYFYDVKPDTAGFVAAAMVAHKAMENAIAEALKPTPQGAIPYTKKQLEIIQRYREEMMQAGGMLPEWWMHTRPWDIASAAIDAVRKFAP